MFRPLAFCIALSIAPPAGAETPAPGAFPGTCRYFDHRATATGRDSDRAAWLGLLAQSCTAALDRYAAADLGMPADRVYLERLTTLRRVVIGMNIARFTDVQPGTRTLRIRRSVSDSGEYLIARHLGVMDALAAWAAISGFHMAALPAD